MKQSEVTIRIKCKKLEKVYIYICRRIYRQVKMCARGVKELKSVSTAKRGWKNHNRVLLLGGTVLRLAIWTFMDARPTRRSRPALHRVPHDSHPVDLKATLGSYAYPCNTFIWYIKFVKCCILKKNQTWIGSHVRLEIEYIMWYRYIKQMEPGTRYKVT